MNAIRSFIALSDSQTHIFETFFDLKMKDQLIIKFYSEPTTNRLPLHDFAHETLQQLVLIVPLYVFFYL
jgi:hypothetical protein